jgi:hypothetical protein
MTNGTSADDFDNNWRFATEPTLLQTIGLAIAAQQEISTLRYPSAAGSCAQPESQDSNCT